MKKVPLTVRGANLLREELNQLRSVARPKVIQDIAEARAHGDLKENAEYHAAREQQGFIEGRIRDIEHKLAHAHVIDISTLPATGRVVFGVTVDLEDLESGEMRRYQIVGEDEANIKQGLISVSSPLARAMIGKEEGDLVLLDAPGGARELEIVEIRYQ